MHLKGKNSLSNSSAIVFAIVYFFIQTQTNLAQAKHSKDTMPATRITGNKNAGIKLAQAHRPPPSRSAAAIAVQKKGTQLIDSGKLPEALSLFRDYCRNWPGDPKGYFWMGVCYDEMNNLPFAVQAYRDGISKAEQDSMDSCEIRTNLANVLLKLNDTQQAIENYKRAIEINPQYGLALLNLGRAQIAASDCQSALASFQKCDDLHFNPRQLSYYKAKAFLCLGRKDEAAALINKFLQDFPESKTRAEILEEFQPCLPK